MLIITWCEFNNSKVLEEIQDISNLDELYEQASFEKLQGVPLEHQTELPRDNRTFYSLRARYNSNRTYFHYGISMPDNVTNEMISDNFDGFSDLIKTKGIKLNM